MSNVGIAIKRELFEMVPILIFFIAAFNLLVLTESLILRQYGIRVEAAISATIGALIIARVVLITDHAAITRRFQHRSLLHNVLWRAALYFVVSIAIRYAEHLIHFWRKTGSRAEANSRLLKSVVWRHALSACRSGFSSSSSCSTRSASSHASSGATAS